MSDRVASSGAYPGRSLTHTVPYRRVTEVEAEEANERNAKPLADEWFYEQPAYPLKDIPHGARSRAVEQLESEERRLLQRNRALSVESADSISADPAWQLVGPMPIANGN